MAAAVMAAATRVAVDGAIDKVQVRRAFSRAAVYGRPAPAEVVAERLVERLDEVALAPQTIADIGGGGCPILARKYPDAKMIAVDFSLPVLRFCFDGGDRDCGDMTVSDDNRDHGDTPDRDYNLAPPCKDDCNHDKKPSGSVSCLLADVERLPLADGCLDLVYSNLCLEWTDAGVVLDEAARVLRPGGVLVFSTLGPDTLREMRAAFDGRVHSFLDMHDIGDMLAPRGFAEPVMQREEIRLTYSRPLDVVRELHLWGAGFAGVARRRGLMGRAKFQHCLSAYPCDGDGDGAGARYAATFEVIYALAWRGEGGGAGGGAEREVRFFPRSVYNAKV